MHKTNNAFFVANQLVFAISYIKFCFLSQKGKYYYVQYNFEHNNLYLVVCFSSLENTSLYTVHEITKCKP